MVNTSNTVHCLIVPIEKTHIVLPNSLVAEVVKFSEPEPINGSPDWLLGHITWQNSRVPVCSQACWRSRVSSGTPATVPISAAFFEQRGSR